MKKLLIAVYIVTERLGANTYNRKKNYTVNLFTGGWYEENLSNGINAQLEDLTRCSMVGMSLPSKDRHTQ